MKKTLIAVLITVCVAAVGVGAVVVIKNNPANLAEISGVTFEAERSFTTEAKKR